MLELIMEIKKQAERDLLFAEAKISVCNSLIEKANEKEKDSDVCAEENDVETSVDDFSYQHSVGAENI